MQAFLSLLFNFCVIVMVLRDVQFYYFTIQCETADTVIGLYLFYLSACLTLLHWKQLLCYQFSKCKLHSTELCCELVFEF